MRATTAASTTHQIGLNPFDSAVEAAGALGDGVLAAGLDAAAVVGGGVVGTELVVGGVVAAEVVGPAVVAAEVLGGGVVAAEVVGPAVVAAEVVGAEVVVGAVVSGGVVGAAVDPGPPLRLGRPPPPSEDRVMVTDGRTAVGDLDPLIPPPLPHAVSQIVALQVVRTNAMDAFCAVRRNGCRPSGCVIPLSHPVP
jgi:hypothetical protein